MPDHIMLYSTINSYHPIRIAFSKDFSFLKKGMRIELWLMHLITYSLQAQQVSNKDVVQVKKWRVAS